MQGSSLRVLMTALLLALIFPAPRPVAADPRMLVGPLIGHVTPGAWVSYSFPVNASLPHVLRLESRSGNADVWLYADGERVAVGSRAGSAAEELTWTPAHDGMATAWVTGFGRRVEYRLVVQQHEATAERGQTSPSTRGPAAPPIAQAPRPAPSQASGKVGLQVGHWKHQEAGPPFNKQPGSSGGGKTESEVNLAIAKLTAELLREIGYAVDLLPTGFAGGYRADVVVSIHADGGPSDRRGFFADRPASSSMAQREERLVSLLNAEYGRAAGIPFHHRGTANTRYYYGYYRVTKDTPMALIETGFLTNATDRQILIGDPLRAARGIAAAIDRFLRERD
ncbi:MAG: N-acetylmuramoyl-L-alanine amidase [Chloroflexi bacterium]|nr:N-acetylmuramoyl-L-alanine amidase [Chloroflexota bacterium]